MNLTKYRNALGRGALAALMAAGACTGDSGESPQTLAGRIDRSAFPSQVLGVRAVRDGQTVAAAPVDASGGFSIDIPVGADYRLEVVTRDRALGLYQPGAGGARALTFDVCSGGPAFSLGDIRPLGSPPRGGGGSESGGGDSDEGRPPEDWCDDGGDCFPPDEPPPPPGDDCGDPPPPPPPCDPADPWCGCDADGTCEPPPPPTCEPGDPSCDPCVDHPEWCDPCLEDPEMCDPCYWDPTLCDPCLPGPDGSLPPGCEDPPAPPGCDPETGEGCSPPDDPSCPVEDPMCWPDPDEPPCTDPDEGASRGARR